MWANVRLDEIADFIAKNPDSVQVDRDQSRRFLGEIEELVPEIAAMAAPQMIDFFKGFLHSTQRWAVGNNSPNLITVGAAVI